MPSPPAFYQYFVYVYFVFLHVTTPLPDDGYQPLPTLVFLSIAGATFALLLRYSFGTPDLLLFDYFQPIALAFYCLP